MTEVTIKLACASCGHAEPYTVPLSACPECGNTNMDATYDLHEPLDWPRALLGRPNTIWRFRELLPLRDDRHILSLGEGGTPLLHAANLGAMLGLKHLYIKDERQGPTGSFKDRQASLMISVLQEQGIKELVVASTGNVAIAYSAYAARAGIKLWVFTISSVPADKMREVALYGTDVVKVTGTYEQAKQVASSFAESRGITLDRGIRNIAAKEAMKTIAFEVAAQLGDLYGALPDGTPWRTPDWYVQAVSGGLGPVGVVKGFRDMEALGLSKGTPKLACIQSSGCDPMVRAFQAGLEEAPPFMNPSTRIATVATDVPGIAYGMLRNHILEHGGLFDSVSDDEAFDALKKVAHLEGLSVEPATALAFAGLFKLVREKKINPDEIVVVNCSGHTFPVETHILSDELIHNIDARSLEKTTIPHEGLLAALETTDTRVSRVVVIEDDPSASQLMCRILQAHGVPDVQCAFDGQSGIDLVRSMKPDLIVLDLMMPGVDGFGVLDNLKVDEAVRDIPVIVVTAKDLTPQERKRLAGQTKSLLQKGSFLDEDAIQSLLETLG